MALAASEGRLDLSVARPEGALVRGGAGHFHLDAELFLQCAGHTEFTFPHGQQTLAAEQALLMPARVLHDEQARSAGPWPAQAFRNLVLYVQDEVLSCHLAHEHPPGRPAVLHLESLRHPQAQRIHDWLADAARLGHAAQASTDVWAAREALALVAAALSATIAPQIIPAHPTAAP